MSRAYFLLRNQSVELSSFVALGMQVKVQEKYNNVQAVLSSQDSQVQKPRSDLRSWHWKPQQSYMYQRVRRIKQSENPKLLPDVLSLPFLDNFSYQPILKVCGFPNATN